MSSKTHYWTGLSITMLVFASGLLIPTIIEGVNIAKNVQDFDAHREDIEGKDYFYLKTRIKDTERIYVDYWSYNDSLYDNIPVTFAIMDSDQFEDWYANGEQKPIPINSTFLIEQASGSFFNLKINYDDYIYFLFFNDFDYKINITYDITILPWGHIMAGGLVGVLCLIFAIILIIKMSTTFYYLKKSEKNHPSTVQYHYSTQQEQNSEKQSEAEQFCVSCGAPVTAKTGRYCQNCGSSVTK